MFQYKLGFIPTTFVIIGVGGTGGRIVPLLSQFLRTVAWIQNPKLFLVDYDTVEEKNLVRQNFIRLDIGKPKAIVLAERYGRAFDVNLIPVVRQVKSGPFLLSETSHAEQGIIKTSLETLNNAIILMCVDSVEGRKVILNNFAALNANKNLLFIDAGNEDDFGQIQVFNQTTIASGWKKPDISTLDVPGMGIPFNVEIPTIPYPMEFYETMKAANDKSCADLDQTLAINNLMAASMMGIVQNLVYGKSIPFHKLNLSLTYGTTAELITLEYIEKKLAEANKSFGTIKHPINGISVDGMLSGIQRRILREFPQAVKVEDKTKTVKAKKVKKSEEAEVEYERI